MNTPGSPPAGALAALGERGLIDLITSRLPPAPPDLLVGPGDDAAVVRPERGTLQILTTDALVEGIHFDFRFSAPADVGHKALAVNLSDIAAMGGAPRFALISLMLPGSCTREMVEALIDGLVALARRSKVAVAGGNITRSPGPLVVDVTVVGSARPRRVLTRGGGRAGDRLYVSGTIGAAAAGLAWFRAHAGDHGPASAAVAAGLAECLERHRRPEPRTRLGLLLGRGRAATACMDLSDGLADAVRQVAAASGTGARIDAARLPIHPAAAAWFESQGADPVERALADGDDYELLFAVSGKARGRFRSAARLAQGLPLTHVGELTSEPGVRLVSDGGERDLPRGFLHF